MNRKILLIIIAMLLTIGYAEATFYQSQTTGKWHERSTWKYKLGNSWLNLTIFHGIPNYGQDAITILNTHEVTIHQNLDIDELTINSGGTLTLNSGINLGIVDGPGVDITNNGTFNIGGNLSTASTESSDNKHKPYGILNNPGAVINLTGNYYFSYALQNKGIINVGEKQLSGSVTNYNGGKIRSDRADIMRSGTLTNESGSTIEYTKVINIPASTGSVSNVGVKLSSTF